MGKYKLARLISNEEAKEEDLQYFLGLKPVERLRLLMKLRVKNLGKAANLPMSKKLRIIK